MRERKVLIDVPRRQRVRPEAEQLGLGLEEVTLRVPTDVAAVVSGMTDEAIANILEIDVESFMGFSPWFAAADSHPPLSGWYDLRGPGPFPEFEGRAFFQLDEGMPGGGLWTDGPDARQGTAHSDLFKGHEWRGLAAAWPWGYRYSVPGAKRFRAQLEASL